ncbi:hypothetical protein V5799_005498 [Amblyomma americanum]|uniref:Uncharacterized protein n=1 Tax=Amblyomma americanum TaxID=6943 RepID=A0AAQ4DZ31_AMBAM
MPYTTACIWEMYRGRPSRRSACQEGKRMCPGEILASVEIFLYITCLLQKCIVLPDEGKIQGLDSADIPLAELNRYKVGFLPR